MPKLTSKCPICKKNTEPEFNPFCSKHCADIDLSHWFSEDYRLSSEPRDEEEVEELVNSLKETLDQKPDVG